MSSIQRVIEDMIAGRFPLDREPGKCLRLVRMGVEAGRGIPAGTFYEKIGLKLTERNRREDPSNPWAVSVEETMRAAGLSVPSGQVTGGMIAFARPSNPRAPQFDKYGHCGLTVTRPDGLYVLENAVVRRGQNLGGAINLVPLRAWDAPTMFARVPVWSAPRPAVITGEMLRVAAPNLPLERANVIAPLLARAAAEYGIKERLSVLAWIANLAHESMGFTRLEEVWGPTAAQLRYERMNVGTLGNNQPGDGYRFRGRGWVQLTGRYNYNLHGKLIGVNLIAEPDKAAQPDVASRLAALFWKRKGCDGVAAIGNFKRAVYLLNGGYNGLADRQWRYERLLAVWGER